jgi:hypothetical protein
MWRTWSSVRMTMTLGFLAPPWLGCLPSCAQVGRTARTRRSVTGGQNALLLPRAQKAGQCLPGRACFPGHHMHGSKRV